MQSQVDWNSNQYQVNGIPEPPPPKSGGISGSVAQELIEEFNKIFKMFKKGVFGRDAKDIELVRKLAQELNKLKELMNEMGGSGSISKNFNQEVANVLNSIGKTIDQIPSGALRSELTQAFKGVETFFNSPFAKEFEKYLKDLNAFKKIWKKVLNSTTLNDSLVSAFKKALENLNGDQQSLANIVGDINKSKQPQLYKIFHDLQTGFDNFWNHLMGIEAGTIGRHHSLGACWGVDHSGWPPRETLEDWMRALMVKEGRLHSSYGWDYRVHKFDGFQSSHYLEKAITACNQASNSKLPPKALAELIQEMTQEQINNPTTKGNLSTTNLPAYGLPIKELYPGYHKESALREL